MLAVAAVTAMDHWIFVTLLLTTSIFWTVNGFLFTPKFQIFLNQMRESGAHKEFVVQWDFNKQNGFSHTTNQFGEFLKMIKSVNFCFNQSTL